MKVGKTVCKMQSNVFPTCFVYIKSALALIGLPF
mgnify:CR=1 FL=1